MFIQLWIFIGLTIITFSSFSVAAEPTLSEKAYSPDMGVIIIQVTWGCGQFENAQLQKLIFTKSPIEKNEHVFIELKTPSRLLVEDEFLAYAFVVQPGKYVLTAFDVKAARSKKDIIHITGSKDNLVKDGKPIGGSFTVNRGEIVYIGHFGLDCGAEPFLWRYYVDGREEFERYIKDFRQTYPFLEKVPVKFRLFSTEILGNPYSLQNPTVR